MATPDLTLISEETLPAHLTATFNSAKTYADTKKAEAIADAAGKYGPIPIGDRKADELFTQGTYWTNKPELATVANGFPVPGAQTIITYMSQGDPDSQAQLSVSYSGGMYKRHAFNGVFVPWERQATVSDMDTARNAAIADAAGKYGPIPIGARKADELLTPGTYWVNDVTTATLANGYPIIGSQTIMVLKNQGDSDSLTQLSISYSGSIYKRHSHDAIFVEWDRQARYADVQALRIEERAARPFNVGYYGAKGVTGQDALPAFIAALDAAAAEPEAAKVVFPRGRFEMSDECNIYRPNAPRKDLVIEGESQWSTKVLANFYGADKSLLKSNDASDVRSSPTSISNLQLGVLSETGGTSPVMLDIFGSGESRFESLRFGPTNNTHMRVSSLQNVRMRDVVSFYGGKHYNYRPANGATFTLEADGTLTIAGAIFATKDVGHHVILRGTNLSRHKITAHVSSTVVMVDGVGESGPKQNVTGAFAPPRASLTAGSDLMNTTATVFKAGDVGRTIYIRNAKAGAWGPALLRATILEIMPEPTPGYGQVRLDKVATRTVAGTEFAVPVIDFWKPEGISGVLSDSNDVKLDLLHIENYGGVGLVVDGAEFFHINDLKIHGEHDPIDTRASTSMMWLNDFGGVVSGELDGVATGSSRVALSSSNDLATFDWLATRHIKNQQIFNVDQHTNENGIIEVRSLKSYGGAAGNGDPYQLVSDTNTPRKLFFTGLTDLASDSSAARFYVGVSYFDVDGVLHTPQP